MYADEPQLAISRVLAAPRELAFRAFTDPDRLATWWGPSGNTLPRGEIEFDVRPGGFQRWTEVSAAQPDLRVHVHIDLTDVAMATCSKASCTSPVDRRTTSSRSKPDSESSSTTSPTDRTRIEIRQWLPARVAGPSNQRWLEALEKLDAALLHLQAAATAAEV
jgi:Activator of Hsp90 ATPase homolog 1-like protein